MADRIRRDPALPFQEVEGQAVIVAPARRELHELDEAATFLWAQLARPRTVEDLVEAVLEEFEVDRAAAEKDVRAFAAALEEKGLVIRG